VMQWTVWHRFLSGWLAVLAGACAAGEVWVWVPGVERGGEFVTAARWTTAPRCFDRACLARERICWRFAPDRLPAARAEEAARRATARSSAPIAAIVAWSAPLKSLDRAAVSRELATEESRRRGTLVPPVPANVTKRTAIPASSTIAAATRRCFLGLRATSVLRSSVSGARRRAAARLIAASRARSAVPLGPLLERG
jgi:hypothetical protein